DQLARSVAAMKWTDELTRQTLKALAASGGDFQESSVSATAHARRAERLGLALERLSLAAGRIEANSARDAELDRLFKLTQSIPDFEPATFAEALKAFAK